MSIKNQQTKKNTSFIIIFFFYIYTNTQVLCMAVWRNLILMWCDDKILFFLLRRLEMYTKPYMHKETIDSS